ncbi:hypothetical protein C8Q74DRAFT_634647 [Fomes fomentarius]|nr:hypothetical protein C8Q74DRAFT_634647 [Fomes fomentarius]
MRSSTFFKVAIAALQVGVVTANVLPTRDAADPNVQLCLETNPTCGANQSCAIVPGAILPGVGICAAPDVSLPGLGGFLSVCTSDSQCLAASSILPLSCFTLTKATSVLTGVLPGVGTILDIAEPILAILGVGGVSYYACPTIRRLTFTML